MQNNAIEKVELPSVKHIIVVASGKGGVGKSTIAANLALALAQKNKKVGLIDADIFGPSIPAMFGVTAQHPEVITVNDKNKIKPIEKYGIKLISIGFFVPVQQSIIWRGPMVSNAVMQLFTDTEWGELDYLIIDFPPGTGDVQITTAQQLHLSGAIIVTTPQTIAVNDARKGTEMFTHQGVSVPLLGVVENMAWFTPAAHPDEKYFIFGKGGGNELSKEFNIPLLAQIPLIQEVVEMGDEGNNLYVKGSEYLRKIFDSLAQKVIDIVK